MFALLIGACIGVVLGVYLERAFDVSFRAASTWNQVKAAVARLNDWRKG